MMPNKIQLKICLLGNKWDVLDIFEKRNIGKTTAFAFHL